MTKNKCDAHVHKTIASVEGLIEFLKPRLAGEHRQIDNNSEIVNLIDEYNKGNDLLDYHKTVFDTEYDDLISYEVQKTYENMQFTSVVQLCDCENSNLLEHLWSAISLVNSIINRFDTDPNNHLFYFEEFKYYIFLTLENERCNDADRLLQLLNKLIQVCNFEKTVEFVALRERDDLDNVLYQFRQEKKLEKIDLLLLLDNKDVNNLRSLKVVETHGLIQPLSFILSTSEDLIYSRYVNYTPCEKNQLLKKASCVRKNPGRWNLVYQSSCLPSKYYNGLTIEMTRCVEYLDG